MSRLTPRQARIATILGLVAYGLAVAGVVGWLVHYGDTMRRIMAAQVSRVTVVMAEPKATPVPESWQAKAEPPAALPPPAAAAKPMESPPVTAVPRYRQFARAFNMADKRARLVLIVPAFAMTDDRLHAAIGDLPADVTLAFASGATKLQQTIDASRTAGHEAVLAVPMEPQNYPQNDPGNNALLTGLADEANIARLTRGMAQAAGYVAVMPIMGEKFVASEPKLTPVLLQIQRNGAAFLDSTAGPDSVVGPAARLAKLPFARTDIIIDASQNGADTATQLAALEKLARDKGQAVAIVLPYPAALEQLKAWSAALDKKLFALAPLTAALQ